MTIDHASLPATPALLRVRKDALPILAYWDGAVLRDLAGADARLRSLDRLLSLSLAEIRALVDGCTQNLPILDEGGLDLVAPVENQEVWAAGVTYLRSREARIEEAAAKDVYSLVYAADRPELFFKGAGWRVVGTGGEVGIRSDSTWNVPEPELAVLCNRAGDVVAYACGNDMSSRSIEGENPLYLPQAKIYDASCALGPAAVLAWHVEPRSSAIHLIIERSGAEVVSEVAGIDTMIRDPGELARLLGAAYSNPCGVWLLTGTPIVPDGYTAHPGDIVRIAIDGLGELRNRVKRIEHSGASALPRNSD